MNNLIKHGYSLVDYEGDIEGFHRNGEGAQDWGDFCRFEGRFRENQCYGNGQLTTRKFPFALTGFFESNEISEGKVDIDNGAIVFEGQLNKDFGFGSGIFTFRYGAQLHLLKKSDQIEGFEFFVNEEKAEKEENTKDGKFVYLINRAANFSVEFDQATGRLAVGNLNREESRSTSHVAEIHLKANLYWIKNYKDGLLAGPQFELNLSPNSLCVKSSYMIAGDEVSLNIAYPNGKGIRREGKRNKAAFFVKGSENYISGFLNQNDELDGAADLILDGKYQVKCTVTRDKVTFDHAEELLKGIEKVRQQILEEIDHDKLNGFHEYTFESGFTYKGYFLNDFVYCHKDSLPSSLTGLYKNKHPDFDEFFGRIVTFEGLIDNWNIIGQAKVKYRVGEIYLGKYSDNYQREGQAIQIQKDGKLYVGEFQRDEYNGVGKLIDQGLLKMGYFRDGKLRIPFDIDNIGTGVINTIRALMSRTRDGDINEAELKKMLEENRYAVTNEELERQKQQEEDELRIRLMVDDSRKKKMKDEQKLLDDLSHKVVIETIFTFKNKWAYHGKVMGNFIMDHDEGDIIDPSGRRIPVRYKALNDLEVGTFKSKDNKHLFMFKYSVRILADIEIDAEMHKDETPGFS
jgi:hypothetical protein